MGSHGFPITPKQNKPIQADPKHDKNITDQLQSSTQGSGALSEAGSSTVPAPSAPSNRRVNRLEFVVPDGVPVIPLHDDEDDVVDLTVFSEWSEDGDEAYAVCAVRYDMTCTMMMEAGPVMMLCGMT